MVILNKSDYIKKMDNILLDETKFERIGSTSTCDNTTGMESRLQKRLLALLKSKLISEHTYQEIRPTGSQKPRMYGLPKTHKPNVPLRKFSFDNIIYKPIDRVAMSSPLGPALANIFVGYYEEKIFSEISKPDVYFRYVDDTFAIFRNEKDSEEFLTRLNDLHSSLRFTCEKEKNNSLPFLDVHVKRTKTNYETSVYRKPIRSLDNTYAGNLFRR